MSTDDVPRVLYHYCDVDGFMAIIESRTIWLSNMRHMNDYIEHNWLVDIARAFIRERRAIEPSAFYDLLDQTLTETPLPDTYCASFSSKGDLLSQWRAYAADGTGFSIGFDPAYFDLRPVATQLTPLDQEHIGLWRVSYDPEEHRKYLESWLQQYLYHAAKYAVDKRANALLAHRVLWRESVVCKNPAFSEEHEWRVVYTPPSDPAQGLKRVKFRSNGRDIVPYYTLEFSQRKENSPISEVVLGPKNQCRTNIRTVELLLDNSGLDPKQVAVKSSLASYR